MLVGGGEAGKSVVGSGRVVEGKREGESRESE